MFLRTISLPSKSAFFQPCRSIGFLLPREFGSEETSCAGRSDSIPGTLYSHQWVDSAVRAHSPFPSIRIREHLHSSRLPVSRAPHAQIAVRVSFKVLPAPPRGESAQYEGDTSGLNLLRGIMGTTSFTVSNTWPFQTSQHRS